MAQSSALEPAGRKVLVLSHMFPHPDQPGSGTFVLEQVAALRRWRGMDVRVVSARYGGPGPRRPLASLAWELGHGRRQAQAAWQEAGRVPVLYPPRRLHWGLVAYGWSYGSAVRACLDQVRESFAFDLVHAHTGFLDGAAGLWAARRYKVPLVITEHTGPFSYLTGNPLVRRPTLQALEGADAVIAVSRAQRDDVAAYLSPQGAAKLRVIPNGVDMDLFRPPDRSGLDPARPRILFAGGAEEVKDPAGVLAALALVRGQVPGARLIMTGGPGDRERESRRLARLIQQSGQGQAVEYVGYQDRQGMARLLGEGCDLLVLASRTESFGCVLIEAMACGHPVVATRCGGPQDIVTRDFLGELAPVGDPQGLARAVLRVIERLPSFEPSRIREHARKHYSFQVVSQDLARLYEQVLAGESPQRRGD